MRVLDRTLFLLMFHCMTVAVASPQGLQEARTADVSSSVRTGNIAREGKIEYRQSSPKIREVNDRTGRYLRLSLPGHHSTSDEGLPELPVYTTLVQTRPGEKLSAYLSHITAERIVFAERGMKGAQVYPAQRPTIKNQQPDEAVSVKDKKVYRRKSVIMHDTLVVAHEGTWRGKEIWSVSFYPAFYNPSEGFLDIITSASIDCKVSGIPVKGTQETVSEGEPSQFSSDEYIPGYTEQPASMVIITDSLFQEHLQPLVRWKQLKGIKTSILCRGEGPPDTVYKDLKNRITALYNESLTSGFPLQYLLIVGDLMWIPSARGTTNVSDLYYGEFDSGGDYIPELFIGRLPVRDTSQLKGAVKKIIDYEQHRFTADNKFWKGTVITAGNASGFEKYMNGQVSYVHDNYLAPDTSLIHTSWLYPVAQTKDDSLKILFNNGLSLLNYTGHGEAEGFSDPVFKVSDVSSLSNTGKYPFVIANACRTAQINVSSCFGSAMVNAADKGALGYIGCTNDSYWTEDFYWAVGPGNPDNPLTYSNTGLGAFDRLFHNHGEEPGDWYFTMGQVNFAGNMAVSASTSSRKKYYWETYMLLGDPSLSPLIGTPDSFRISIPDTLPQAMKKFTFFSKPFSYAAISDFDTLWDARHVSPSGSVTLSIPAGEKDSCLVIVTGQDMVTYMKTVYFGQVSGPFLVAENILLDDHEGNSNGFPDYGERIDLNVTISNLGSGTSTGLKADISALHGPVTTEPGNVDIGDLAPGQSFNVSDRFFFGIADDATDRDLASLLLSLTDSRKVFTSAVDMTVRAPDLEIISAIHDDSEPGNSNFLPDPGERIGLNVTLKNKGSSSTSGTISLSAMSSLLTVDSPELSAGQIDPGSQKTVTFSAVISPAAIPGTELPFGVKLVCGKYEAADTFSIRTGKTRETWEYERFDIFPWIQPKQYPWIITSSDAFENTRSARSWPIPDKSESVLSVSVNNPVKDTISFWYKVSSEFGYDELVFSIDSTVSLKVSGETNWVYRQAVLKPGVHTVEWKYRKDVSLSGGLDAAWIDKITFPDISFLEADISVDTVFPPPATADLANVTVTGRVVNLGRNTLTSFPLAYRVNEGTELTQTFFQKIAPGDTLDIAFTETCRLRPGVTNKIYIIGRLPEDGYHGNDTASVTYLKTAVDDRPADAGTPSLRPNPFRDSFVLKLEAESEPTAEFEMFDNAGRTVMRQTHSLTPGLNEITVDASRLPPGIYTLSIKAGLRHYEIRAVKGS